MLIESVYPSGGRFPKVEIKITKITKTKNEIKRCVAFFSNLYIRGDKIEIQNNKQRIISIN
jgi:hypothetical protein